MEHRVGRLVEARVRSLVTREDADTYSRELGQLVTSLPRVPTPVLGAHHRPVGIYPPQVTERLVELFAQMNTHLDRIAVLLAPTNAVLSLQLERLVRAAGNDRRRVFQDATLAARYLKESLDAREGARARTFLSSGSS